MVSADDVARVQALAMDVAEGEGDAAPALLAMCDALGRVSAVASLHAPGEAEVAFGGYARVDPDLLTLLADRFSTPETSPQVEMLSRMRGGRLDHYSRYIDPDALRRTDYYNEFWHPSKVGEAGGLVLRLPDDRYAFATIGCETGRDWLDDAERRAGEAMLMSIARALRLRDALSRGRAQARLDGAAPNAALLLSPSGYVRLRNAAAAALFASAALVQVDRRVWPRSRAARGPFARNVATALSGAATADILRDRDRFLRVRFEPGPPCGEGPTALVTIGPARPFDWTEGALRARLGLTPQEAKVVLALCRGASTAAIAAEIGLKAGSVRLYLKRAFAKLGTHGQADLVRFVLDGRAPD